MSNSSNPQAGGLGGLFSEAADWIGGIGGAARDIVGTIGNIRLQDQWFDLEEARLQAARRDIHPASAPAAASGAGVAVGGQEFSWPMVIMATLAGVVLWRVLK